jgi:hypothetical protein
MKYLRRQQSEVTGIIMQQPIPEPILPQNKWTIPRKRCMNRRRVTDERAMKARFEEWMKKYEKTNQDEEEKAMMYEIFKAAAIRCDRNNNTPTRAHFAPNNLGLFRCCLVGEKVWVRLL